MAIKLPQGIEVRVTNTCLFVGSNERHPLWLEFRQKSEHFKENVGIEDLEEAIMGLINKIQAEYESLR